MRCEECDVLIYTFPESTLHEQETVRKHLTSCISCREKFDAFIQQKTVLKKLAATKHASANENKIIENIMTEVYREQRSTASRPSLFTLWLPMRYAAAILSLVLVGAFVHEFAFSHGSQQQRTVSVLPVGTRAARLVTAGFVTAKSNEKAQPERASLKELAYCAKQLHSSSLDQSCSTCKKCQENPFN